MNRAYAARKQKFNQIMHMFTIRARYVTPIFSARMSHYSGV